MVRHWFTFAPDGDRMSPRNDYANVTRGYKSKYYKRKMAAAWRAVVRRRQANGRLGANLNEGDYVGFRINMRADIQGNYLRNLPFAGLIDYVETPTTFRVRFHGPFYD